MYYLQQRILRTEEEESLCRKEMDSTMECLRAREQALTATIDSLQQEFNSPEVRAVSAPSPASSAASCRAMSP